MAPTLDIGGLPIDYDATVLEPRPWTAQQSAWAAELSPTLPPGPLLELCCGAGHIGLLTVRLTGRDAVLVDASEDACRFAEQNAAQVRPSAVEVRRGPMTEVLDEHESFPLVLADPPYLPTRDVASFPEDPTSAIDGGEDGLDLARLCLGVGGRHLAPGGAMVLQLRDVEQAEALSVEAALSGLRLEEARAVGDSGALALLRRARRT